MTRGWTISVMRMCMLVSPDRGGGWPANAENQPTRLAFGCIEWFGG
jgi:hypothetical protein